MNDYTTNPMRCWHILGIAPTGDEAAIKKAYAARLREHRPDRDPAGFRRVRAAYEAALQQRTFVRPPPVNAAPPPANSGYYGYTATFPVSSESLCETAPHDYLDRPADSNPATREVVPHGYLDRPASPATADLPAGLYAAWENAADDAALCAVLQAQAAQYHEALQFIDRRSDYLAALRDYLLSRDDVPRSTVWAGEHYQLHHGHDGEYRRRHLAILVALRERTAFVRALAPHYPDLAAWLQLGRWQRFRIRWQDWLVQDEQPAHREWQALRASLQEALMRYRDNGKLRRYLRILVMSVSLFASIATFAAPPPFPLGGIVWFLILTCRHDLWSPADNPARDGTRLLYRVCPSLRSLEQAYRRWPYWPLWLLADAAVIALSLDDAIPVAATLFWLIARAFSVLWQFKRVIAAQTPPLYTPPVFLSGTVALAWLAFTTFILAPNGDPELAASACGCGILLYLLCWWRIPADRIAARRAFLDHGFFTIPASIVMANLDTPTPWACIACPLLALTLGYRHRLLAWPARLRPLAPLARQASHFALLAISLINAIGAGYFAFCIWQDGGEWPMTAFILLCLLHAIASIEYHLQHPV